MNFTYKILIILILNGLLTNCNNQKGEVQLKNKVTSCLDEISITISGSNFHVMKKNNILYSAKASKKRDFLFLQDTANQKLFSTYGYEILLVDCLNDTVYVHENLVPHWSHLAMSNLDTIEGNFIFHNGGEFILFDNQLNLQYSHRNFIDSLFKSGNIGFEGIMVDDYTKKGKFIEITYLLDLNTLYPDTIIETISLPTKIIND